MDRASSVLLLTRPAGSNERVAALLRPETRDLVEIVVSPLIEICAVPPGPLPAGNFAAIFTSSNGVRHAPHGEGRRAWCVGERTAGMARAAGWQAMQAGEDAEGLLAALKAARPEEPLVHFSGTHQRGDIVERLTVAGVSACRVTVYDQKLLPLSRAAQEALRGTRPVFVPLFSPRTAAHFASFLGKGSTVYLLALSEAVANVLPSALVERCEIAGSPAMQAMVTSLEKLITKGSLA